MKIHHKLLGVTLPIALIALFIGAYVTFQLSRQALHQIGGMWLENRLEEGLSLVQEHETFLRMYGITNIHAGTRKAQYDALESLAEVQVGEKGYIFVINLKGEVVYYPELNLNAPVIENVETKSWFQEIRSQKKGEIIYTLQGKRHLGKFDIFDPWGWIVIVADPYDEIYGSLNKTKGYLLNLAVWSSVVISLFIIGLTRHLFKPLQLLVNGAEKVTQGDLDIKIPIKSNDEMGNLSRVFNSMAHELKKNLDDLQASEAQLHYLNSQLLTAQEDERKRVATELHDEVGQSLTVMKLKMILLEERLKQSRKVVEEGNDTHVKRDGEIKRESEKSESESENAGAAEACEEMVQYIDITIENVRRLCRDLTPTVITDLGLEAALMWLIENMADHFEITAEVRLDDADEILSLDRQLMIYRIFQEALSNAARHSQATHLQLTAIEEHGRLILSIEDNGVGFDYQKVRAGSLENENRGLGLATIKERARMLGARIKITTGKNAGTRLHFSVPIDKGRVHGNL